MTGQPSGENLHQPWVKLRAPMTGRGDEVYETRKTKKRWVVAHPQYAGRVVGWPWPVGVGKVGAGLGTAGQGWLQRQQFAEHILSIP